MSSFNPFKKVDGSRGAPMGRHGDTLSAYDGASRLFVRHCGGDGYYDKGGAYWGHSRVRAVFTRSGAFCAYVEASSDKAALALVLEASGFAGATPGPWKVHKAKRRITITDENGNLIAVLKPVRLFGIAGNDASNAALLVAAPLMRDTLRRAEIAVQELCNGQDPANECWNILREVQTALAGTAP